MNLRTKWSRTGCGSATTTTAGRSSRTKATLTRRSSVWKKPSQSCGVGGSVDMRIRTRMTLPAILLPCLLAASLAPLAASDAPPADVVPFAGLSPQDACDKATLPPGFRMHVFAGEPDVRQPIAFCLDHRGRVWVAEGFSYPRRHGSPPKTDAPSGTPTAEQWKD